jgi:dephospho-CoA kinase
MAQKAVIGLTGTIASGKDAMMQILLRKYNCYHVTLSDVIRGELEKRKDSFNRVTLQDMGNTMRQQYGPHILALLAVEYLPRDKELTVIDGIRNPGEVDYLKKKFGGKFFMVATDAPRERRFELLQQRGDPRDPQTFEEFVKVDDRDQGVNEPVYGQQVAKCVERADFRIQNDGDLAQLEQKVDEVMKIILAQHAPQ